MSEQNAELLKKYLPAEVAITMSKWIDHFQVELTISKPRQSVLGDYRHPHAGRGHRISINVDLNPYAFLITLIHEFAHLSNWNTYRNKVKAHGEEWKTEYKRLMNPFIAKGIFPERIETALRRYMNNPAAASCTDIHLLKVLKEFDPVSKTVFVSTVPMGAIFKMKSGREFQKMALLRKRFKCKEIATGAIYLFSPVSEVYYEGSKN
jgi:SprT protein